MSRKPTKSFSNSSTKVKSSSNGAKLDGSSMNIGNRLGDRPCVKLFPEKDTGKNMLEALTDAGMGFESGQESTTESKDDLHKNHSSKDGKDPEPVKLTPEEALRKHEEKKRLAKQTTDYWRKEPTF